MRAAISGSQTVRRAFSVLRLVAAAQEQGARLTDLVATSGLTRPTVHRLLAGLRDEGVVEQDPLSRRYRIGPELTLLGMARGNRFPIRAMARPFLEQLSARVGDTAFLTVRQGSDSIGVDRATGSHPIQVLATEIGVRRPLGAGVAGVAILSTLPTGEAAALAQGNLRRLAALGLTPGEVEERAARARKLGYAWAPEGVVARTSAVSVPVPEPFGGSTAALSIAAMAPRLAGARLPAAVEALRDAAAGLAARRDALRRQRASR